MGSEVVVGCLGRHSMEGRRSLDSRKEVLEAAALVQTEAEAVEKH